MLHILHTLGSIDCIPELKDSFNKFIFGFRFHDTSLVFFNLCQRFSMGFRSGNSAGVFHHNVRLIQPHPTAFEVCFGSLSRMNLGVESTFLRYGTNPDFKTSFHPAAIILPSNITIGVFPLQAMLAQTWTFGGCFGLLKSIIYNAHTVVKIYKLT